MANNVEEEFVERLKAEREYQRKTWTDPRDDRHDGTQWGGLLARYVGRVVENALAGNRDLYRKSLYVLASVALAAYEADFRRSESFLKREIDVAPPEAST